MWQGMEMMENMNPDMMKAGLDMMKNMDPAAMASMTKAMGREVRLALPRPKVPLPRPAPHLRPRQCSGPQLS